MAERVPCPHCAELILPSAKFCRFCRKTVTAEAEAGPSMFPSVDEKEINVPAIVALPLAILAWPVCGIFFFIVYGSSRLLQSMRAGVVVAVAGMACGIVGLCLATRANRKTGGLLLSIGSMGLATLTLASFMVTAIMARATSKMIDSTTPASQASGAQPAPSAVKQILGTEKPTQQPMKCSQCGHEFETSSMDLVKQQMGMGLQVLSGGGGDINALLDQVDATGVPGYPCPACHSSSAHPLLTCPQCQTQFAADQASMVGTSARCPHCGTAVPVLSNLLGGMDLENALNSMP